MRRLLADSAIVASHREGDPRVQDAYSLRCAPQVIGAARDTLAHAITGRRGRAALARSTTRWCCPTAAWSPAATSTARRSASSATSSPSPPPRSGAIAERRTDRLLDATRSHGLPPFLTEDPGVNSGLMIAHYTQAAMVAENRRLAAPASVDSLPTSAMQEDHVSMGWGAARKLRASLDNLRRILAVELVCAARGLDLRAPLRTGAGAPAPRWRRCASACAGPGPDRHLAPELAAAEELVGSGRAGGRGRVSGRRARLNGWRGAALRPLPGTMSAMSPDSRQAAETKMREAGSARGGDPAPF